MTWRLLASQMPENQWLNHLTEGMDSVSVVQKRTSSGLLCRGRRTEVLQFPGAIRDYRTSGVAS